MPSVYNEKFSKNELKDIRKTPFSLDAERSILGSLMLDNDAWLKIEDFLVEDDFYLPQHRLVFKKIHYLNQKDFSCDVVTLSDALEREKLLESAGGLHYLAEIVKNTPMSSNILAYAKIIKEHAKLRMLLKASKDISDMVYSSEGKKIEEILDIAEQKILAIAENNLQSKHFPKHIEKIIPDVIDKIDVMMDSQDGITGISSGFIDLDEITSGLHPSNLVIIAGRPSMGKTTFAINLVEKVSKNSKKPVLVFSLEMPSEDIILKMISSLGKIDQHALRNGRLDNNSWSKITSVMDSLSKDFNIHVDDSANLNPFEMRSRARKIYKENDGLSMVVVDYLQLMKVPGYQNNRTQEVSEISRSLKSLAKELSIPVVALSQLNRGVDDRVNKRPLMSDLRESGAIEQDADVIMFIYRDEVYNKDRTDNKGLGEIIIGKQRNGPTGNIKVYFEGKYCRFMNFSYAENIPVHY